MRLVGRFSRGKTALRLLGAVAFIMLGTFLLHLEARNLQASVAGFLALGFGISMTAILLLSLLGEQAMLELDDRGILDRRSVDRHIPWTEIRSIRLVSGKSGQFLLVDIGEPVTRYTDDLAKRTWLKINQGFARGVPINWHGLDVSKEAVLDEIQRRVPARMGSV